MSFTLALVTFRKPKMTFAPKTNTEEFTAGLLIKRPQGHQDVSLEKLRKPTQQSKAHALLLVL